MIHQRVIDELVDPDECRGGYRKTLSNVCFQRFTYSLGNDTKNSAIVSQSDKAQRAGECTPLFNKRAARMSRAIVDTAVIH